MALRTQEHYERSLKNRQIKIFLNGKRVEDVFDNPNIRTVIKANKASYQWALDLHSQWIMTAGQHGVGTWHEGGSAMAQKSMIQRSVHYEHEKSLVRKTLKNPEN